MSESIGSRLPPPLRFELGNLPHAEQAGAALLISVDEDGFPRVALLSSSEIEEAGERSLRFRVYAASHTARNLLRAKRATLWSVLDAAAYSVRGEVIATPVPVRQGASDRDATQTFALQVTDVLRDFRADAPLISGAMYRRTAGEPNS
ncbi:MAG: hypothetical protein M3Z37_00490 [Candidatus Eremiobacteraeota bacterium]|nr:hypothetical protein [Candidatus Eremiobacteraeota bacterium]